MSARHLVNRDSETLARHPPLELRGKESIIASYENAGWHVRPRLETARRSKYGIRLTGFALRESLVNHRLWYVMEKVVKRIERSVGRATVAYILLALRLGMASVSPPLTRSFARLRDHRIDQHQRCDW